MQHRRNFLRAGVVACALLVVGCGGGGNSASSTTSSSSTSSASSSSVSKKVKDAYESALADLGTAFNDSADARIQVVDAPGVTTAQPLLRDLRDAWFGFDKTVRDLDFPTQLQTKVNAVLTADGTVIADLDKFNEVERPEAYNALESSLEQDIDAFRGVADKLATALGVQGTRDASSGSSSSSSTRESGNAGAIADAKATRDTLVQLAQQPGSVDASAEPAITTWPAAVPGVDFIGSALSASPTEISGFAIVVSKSKDVEFLAFAVQDAAGTCAGAVLEFNATDTAVTAASTLDDVTGQCSANTVSDALGF